MRYVILGAGAIGAAIGGRLAQAGCPVTLVGRGEHAAAVRRDGLRLVTPGGTAVLDVPIVTMGELKLSGGDVLILAVKSQDTAGLLTELAAVPADGSAADLPVFCAQNGVANEDTALRYFSQVYGACVSIPATHLEPGIVEAPGRPVTGILQLGRYPAGSDDLAAAVAAELTRSGIRARACDDVMAWKRAKLLSNLGNALQVLCTGGHDWRSGSGDAAGELMSALRDEATACYRAAGWPVIPAAQFAAESADFEIAELNGRSRGGGSTWQSVQRGLPTVETDFLNGEIVRLGRLHGVPVPVNAAVQAAMAAVVRRSLRPASLSPAQLLAV